MHVPVWTYLVEAPPVQKSENKSRIHHDPPWSSSTMDLWFLKLKCLVQLHLRLYLTSMWAPHVRGQNDKCKKNKPFLPPNVGKRGSDLAGRAGHVWPWLGEALLMARWSGSWSGFGGTCSNFNAMAFALGSRASVGLNRARQARRSSRPRSAHAARALVGVRLGSGGGAAWAGSGDRQRLRMGRGRNEHNKSNCYL